MAASGAGSFSKRSWRRFRRRPARVQAISWIVVVVVIGGIVGGITASSNSSKPADASTPPVKQTALSTASTSSRGVTATSIRVVFPISNLTNLSSTEGFAGDIEFSQQTQAIDTFVNAINAAGGINGRKIIPDVVNFDATSETDMRSLCKQWTEGSPPVFAVIDGLGAWTGDDELCITQEGHTPMISEWTTIPQWTSEGAPYLWWTGPNQAQVLQALVQWGKQAGLLGTDRKVAIVAGDRPSDQEAMEDYLLPFFKAAGLPTPLTITMPAQTSEQSAIGSDAPLVVEKLQSAGIQSVIPLIPFNAFFPYLQAETTQSYFPKLLLSDYEDTISIGLGLIPIPFLKALNGQEGITTETLGGSDENSITIDGHSTPLPESKGGYDPGVQQCYDIWKAHNAPPKGKSPFIEEQGPIVGWCQAIELFADAARMAGPDLTRRSFVEAMAKVKNFSGTYSPILSYGPNQYAGPTQYQVVRIYNNSPTHNECVLTYNGIPQGTCWQVVGNWKPLPAG
ncbi:MAG: ABC transporter substrate-binding protein [Acidimicrobiales bacterium]